MNLYEVLGVKPDATPDEIKVAYRNLRSKHHPDREGGNADVMAQINVAYETLSDPESRSEYDKTGEFVKRSRHEKAMAAAMDFLDSAINSGGPDIILTAKQFCSLQRTECTTGRRGAEQALINFKRQLRRVRLKAEPKYAEGNFVARMIEDKIKAAEQHVEKMNDLVVTLDRVMGILNDFESTADSGELAEDMLQWTRCNP